MKEIAILGPGLLGGSLALALRARLPGCRIGLWARRQEAVAEVQASGVADHASTDLNTIVQGADTVILCVPIGVMPKLAHDLLPLAGPETLITDVGSVKAPVVDALAPIFEGKARFIGSHPMAGSEQSGLGAAKAQLFEGATCILTPHPGIDPETITRATRLWEIVGGKVTRMEAQAHDETIGLVSHLPHLLASALVDFVEQTNPDATAYCGNGFRDTTRIAAGPAPMWAEILHTNRAALKVQLDRFITSLQNLSCDFDDKEQLEDMLASAQIWRQRLGPSTSKPEAK